MRLSPMQYASDRILRKAGWPRQRSPPARASDDLTKHPLHDAHFRPHGRYPKCTARDGLGQIPRGRDSMKKLTRSKETLRTLDEQELALVAGGDSGSHEPPHGGPNSCPNTKDPGCS